MKRFLRFLCIMAFALMPLWGHSQSPVVDTVPYFCDFEDTVWNHSHWTLINGSCYNFFVIDTSANATPDGSRSLYVTEMYQDALPYSYKPGSSVAGEQSDVASRVFAVAVINFPDTGYYDIGFWWNCYGENVFDYGRVILAPTTYVFTASTGQWDTNTSVPGEYLGAITTPSNCININGSTPLSNVTAPQYRYMTFHISTAGNYQLAVMWLNDGNTGDQPPLMIDDITITPHLCDAPDHLMVDHFTGDTVVMRWDNVAPSYVVMWDTAGVTGTYSHVDTINTNTYMITGLPQNSQYDMLVQAVCPNNSLSMATNYHIIMPDYTCSITELPYTIDFDTITNVGSQSVPADIPCWKQLTNYSNITYAGYPYVYPASSYAHTGSNVLYFYYYANYVSRDGWCLPMLDRSFDLPGVVVDLWACGSSDSRLVVGVMTDPNNIESLVVCDTVAIAGYTPTHFEVPLSNYTGNGRYIAIMIVNSTTGYSTGAYVDDLVLKYEPCVRPGVTDIEVTDTTATISWAPTNGYYYEWTMSLGDDADINRVNDTSLTLTDLSPASHYTLYLRSMCDDAGMWNAVHFRTNCGGLRSLPFYDDFESYTSSSTSAGSPFIDCWERLSSATYWYPYVSTGTPHSGNMMLYWMVDIPPYYNGGYVVLPSIDTNYIPINNVMLKFWARSGYAGYTPYLEVGTMNSQTDTSSFRRYATVDIEGDVYKEYTVAFNNYTDTGTCIAIRSVYQGSFWYGYMDDVSLELIPSCPTINSFNPSSVATTSAYLRWTPSMALDTALNYEIEVVPVDSSIAPATFTTTNLGFFVTGLIPQTRYSARIRAVCDTSNGDWAYTTFLTSGFGCAQVDTTTVDSIAFGAGVIGNDYFDIPVNNYYCYSYVQQLVTSSEMGGSAVITGIDFEYSGSTASTRKSNCTIYMSHTSVNSLASAWVPYSMDYVPVYIGPLNVEPGWNHFEFSTPFSYDGTANLLISILDNSGSYDGSTYTFACHPASGKTRYIYNDGSRYDPATVSGGYSHAYRSNMKIHTVECLVPSTCAGPNVIVERVDLDEVDIVWAAGNNENSWELSYLVGGDSVWNTLGTINVTNYTLSSLTSNTTYYIKVTALCGSEDPSTIVTVTTPCPNYAVPFYENFESWSIGSSAPAYDCYHKSENYPYINPSYNHGSGTQSMYFYSSGSAPYLVLPRFEAPIDSLEITFYMMKPNSYYANTLRVGVMTDPEDPNTFEQVATVEPGMTYEWTPALVQFNNYTGNGQYIAIRTAAGYSYAYLDDIEVNYIPTCPRPTNLTDVIIDDSTATIYWEDTSAAQYEVEWGPVGFAHGTGTTLTTEADSIDITGLSINTQYDVYVRGVCEGEDYSPWSFAHTFWSACFRIDSLPFVEDFESLSLGDNQSPVFVHCWTRLSGITYKYPYVYDYSYYAHSGNMSLYWYATNSVDYGYLSTYSRYVILPEVDSTVYPINTVQLSFWAVWDGYGAFPKFEVGVMTDPGDYTTFVPFDTISVTSTDYTYFDIPFNSYSGYGTFIAIKDINTNYFYGYVDDIAVDTAPSCPRPSRLVSVSNTETTANIAWRERGEATLWEVNYTNDGYEINVDTIVSTNAPTIYGLMSGVEYVFKVRSICGAGDTSDWSDPLIVIPNSWTMRPNRIDTVQLCNGYIFDDGGPTGNYSTSQNSTVIVYPNAPNMLVEIEGTFLTETCCDYLGIYDGVGDTGTQFYYGFTGTEINLGPFISTEGPITIKFNCDSYGEHEGFSLYVNCVSTICRVRQILQDTAQPLSPNMLHLVWDAPEGASYYELEYGNRGFSQGTGTTMMAYTNRATIAGLSSYTNYDVYVRCFCSTGDTGSWTRATFRTELCDNSSQAYSYDGTMSSTNSYYGPIGYSTYNYSYVQTIIDSARFAGITDPISAIAFLPTDMNANTYFTHMDVYMANVPEAELNSGFIMPDSNHVFVRIMNDADLTFNDLNWQMHALDTIFTWDGHSNVLFAVNRRHGAWTSSNNFSAHNTTLAKTRYIYQDISPYDPFDASTFNSYVGYGALNLVGDIEFYACGNSVVCQQPVISSITHDYETATITWLGTGSDYEVNVKESMATDWPATDIVVSGNSYTFTGLQAATYYTFRVRQHCVEDSMYSIWVEDGFLTDSLPCFTPDSLHATAVTNSTATLDWSVNGFETQWDIHVWYSGFDSIYRVTSHPVTIGGFIPGVTYNAAIRAICGSDLIEGDWSNTVTFTTAVCPNVTGLTAGNISANSVTLNWTADPMAQSWVIEYGYYGFDQGTGIMVTSTTNNYVLNGLESETQYDFYVKAVCGTDWMSENWTNINATTLSGGVTCEAPVAVHTTVADNSVTVNWTAGEGNNTFELEYGPHGFSHSAGTIVSANASPATISNLDYETQYDVYVRAICDQNTYSTWSTVSTFTTGEQPSEDCDPVANLNVVEITETTATVTWTPGATGDRWQVVVSDATGSTVSDATVSEPRANLTGLTRRTNYTVSVRTDCGEGNHSSYVTANFRTEGEGIDDVTSATCTIYPNPTSNSTTISVSGVNGKVKIAVVDMNGRTVATETLECNSDCAKTMDVDNLAQGAYFVRITSDSVNMVKKLIVR